MSEAERLAEYAAYYRSRAARYAANPAYPETARAERQMADLVAGATSFDDVAGAMVEASVANGRALARDQANARAAVYAETAEDVRALGPAEVLAGLADCRDAAAIVALTSSVENRVVAAVTADEATRQWTADLVTLENAEVWRSAQVPERWRAQLLAWADEGESAARASWSSIAARAGQHQPGWSFDEHTARAVRHRRLVPLPDSVFERRLAEHRERIR